MRPKFKTTMSMPGNYNLREQVTGLRLVLLLAGVVVEMAMGWRDNPSIVWVVILGLNHV